VFFAKLYWVDKIPKDERGRVCSTRGRQIHTQFGGGNLKEGDHLEDQDILNDNIKGEM
jgi:hypothetical protein